MRRRIIACVIGGLVGIVLSSPINDYFGIKETFGLLTCGISGIILAYMISMVADVFMHTSEESTND